MMLDLHIEGAAPVTLLVRDESRSTRSTSVNKDEDVDMIYNDYVPHALGPAADHETPANCSSSKRAMLSSSHHATAEEGWLRP